MEVAVDPRSGGSLSNDEILPSRTPPTLCAPDEEEESSYQEERWEYDSNNDLCVCTQCRWLFTFYYVHCRSW